MSISFVAEDMQHNAARVSFSMVVNTHYQEHVANDGCRREDNGSINKRTPSATN